MAAFPIRRVHLNAVTVFAVFHVPGRGLPMMIYVRLRDAERFRAGEGGLSVSGVDEKEQGYEQEPFHWQ